MKDRELKYYISVQILVALFCAGIAQAQEKAVTAPVLKTEKVEYTAEEVSDPFAVQTEEPVQKEEVPKKPLPEFKIQGLIWGGKLPQAIVNNKVVMVGDTLEEARIVDINKEGLVVYFEGQQYNITSPGVVSSKIAQAKPEGGIDEE